MPVIAAPAGSNAGPRVTTWAEDLAADRDEAPGTTADSTPLSWLEAERAEAHRLRAEQAADQGAEVVRLRATRTEPTAGRRTEEARPAEAAPTADGAGQAARQLADEPGPTAEAALSAWPPLDVSDEVWLAAETAEADQAAAQAAEEARVADVPAPAEEPDPEELRLADERAEAERITDERRAAQLAEERRLADRECAAAAEIAHAAVRPSAAVRSDAHSADGPSTITRFVQFEPGSGHRYLLGAVSVVASACAVLAALWGIETGSGRAFGLAAVAAVLAALNWWALLNSAPNLVSIREGMLDVSRGADVESFDLREPSTPLVMSGDTRSRSWKATLKTPSGHVITLTARDVDPSQFAELVGNYRALGPVGGTEERFAAQADPPSMRMSRV